MRELYKVRNHQPEAEDERTQKSYKSFFLYNLFIDFAIIKYNTIYYDTVYFLKTLTEARDKAKCI